MGANAFEHARWNNEAWTKAWTKREVLSNSVTPVLLKALELQPGEGVLDIGCGGGRATIAALGQVQPGGRVVGADISEPLLRLAAGRASGLGAITWRRADMQVDELGVDPFDVAMSQFGVMFFDEPVTAFTNIARHVRRGGRLGFACWQAMDRNPWFVGPVLAPFVSAPPAPGPDRSPTGPFTLGDPNRVRQILTEAGFRDVNIDPHQHEVDVPESAVVDDGQLAFMGVTEEDMDDARAAIVSMMATFATEGDLRRFPLAFQIVTARLLDA